MEQPISFGDWVRRRRKALDLTQEALAQRVGCALSTVKKIEADERQPSREMAERLAECLLLPAEQRDRFLRAARAVLEIEELADPAVALHAPAAPAVASAGALTFLFTDIAGSSRLWERHPDEMPAALARHDAMVRAAIAANGGRATCQRASRPCGRRSPGAMTCWAKSNRRCFADWACSSAAGILTRLRL